MPGVDSRPAVAGPVCDVLALAVLLLIIYLLVGRYCDRRHLKPYRESRHV